MNSGGMCQHIEAAQLCRGSAKRGINAVFVGYIY